MTTARTSETRIDVDPDVPLVRITREFTPANRIMTINLVVGSRLPAHATSMGKVLLAHLPPEALDRFFAETTLKRLTKRTLCTEAALRPFAGLWIGDIQLHNFIGLDFTCIGNCCFGGNRHILFYLRCRKLHTRIAECSIA